MLRVFKSGVGLLKKVFLVVAVFYIVITFFLHFINKDKPVYNTQENLKRNRERLYTVLSDKQYKQDKFGKVALLTFRFATCAIMGELCTETAAEGDKYYKGSLLGKTASLVSIPFTNPPASGTYWVTNTLQNAGFIPSTYAAEGMGFAAIKPLMNLWKIFRDVSYLLIVLVLVSIGFMIMFRMKLNPQTVISVENSLPKIVITLLLITFSFAIAGFLIDLMYLSIGLMIGIISNNNAYYDAGAMQNKFFQSNFGTLFEYMMPTQWSGMNVGNFYNPITNHQGIGIELFPRMSIIGDAFMSMFPVWVDGIVRSVAIITTVVLVVKNGLQTSESSGLLRILNGLNIFGNGVGDFPHFLLGTGASVVFYLAAISLVIHGLGFVIGLLVLFTFTGMLFNIFFLLVRSYLQIIVSIIFAPFILLFEAVPGKSVFGFWIKGLIGELISFPVVISILLVSSTLLNTMTSQDTMWTPPFLFQVNPNGLSILIGMGLIFIIPDMIKFTKDAVGAKPLPFNIGASTFFGGAGALVGGGLGLMGQFSTLSLGLTGLNTLKGMAGFGKKSAAASAADFEEAAQHQFKMQERVAALTKGTPPEVK